MNNYAEVEFKYSADSINLTDFIKLMETIGYKRKLNISSWDHYFVNNEKTSFQRYRESETPELTKKLKTKEGNNWVRHEVDLPLDIKRVNEDIIKNYVQLDGYSFNFKIYKTCAVYWQEDCNFVYYITYDENLRELHRYIEVEINKNSVISGQEMTALNHYAEPLKKLGLTPQHRLKKSLFEIYLK